VRVGVDGSPCESLGLGTEHVEEHLATLRDQLCERRRALTTRGGLELELSKSRVRRPPSRDERAASRARPQTDWSSVSIPNWSSPTRVRRRPKEHYVCCNAGALRRFGGSAHALGEEMQMETYCHGHGLTRAGLVTRGATFAGALLVGSAGSVAAANADAKDGHHRKVPHPFEVPDTRLARAVAHFAAGHYPPFLAHHCQRSYDVATLIAADGKVRVDLEVLYAGILLHDLGLTRRFHSSTARFEVASADAARSFVRDHGMSCRRAEAVWDVVVLHGTGGIAAYKSVETFVAADGIGRDVTGLGLDEFPKRVVDRIMRTRPGFAKPFIDAIVTDLHDKAEVANSTWMMLIAEKHIPSFQPISVETLAFGDPYEHAP
jgi:hypothetical protein